MEAPDRFGRESILGVHVNRKELPLAGDVNLREIASMTTGFTGYMLRSIFNFYMTSHSISTVLIKLTFSSFVNCGLQWCRADLANLVNEAALLAGRSSKEVVEKIDFINAVERSIAVCATFHFYSCKLLILPDVKSGQRHLSYIN